jgi:hypothetical protein
MTLEEFVAESKRLGKGKEETIAKAKELQAQGFFDQQEQPQQGMSGTDMIAAIGQKALDGVAFGFGDEIAAIGRAALDPGDFFDNYDMYIKETRRLEDQLDEEAPGLGLGVEIATSLVPGFKIASAVGNMATRPGNMAVQSLLAAGETAVREFGEGEGSVIDRAAQIDPMVVGLGAGIGAAGGMLMRGQHSVDKLANAERKKPGVVRSFLQSVRDDVYTTGAREVGPELARKMSTADFYSMTAKQKLHEEGFLPIKKLDELTKELGSNGAVSKMLGDANAVLKDADGNLVNALTPAQRQARLDAAVTTLKKTNPEAGDTLDRMLEMTRSIQQEMRDIFPKAAKEMEEGYFPLYAKAEPKRGVFHRASNNAKRDASTQARETGFISEQQALEIFQNPVHSFMTFFEDTIDAAALANSYGVKSSAKSLKDIGSYTDNVITEIRKKVAKEQGEDVADDLANMLRIYTIDGRSGMSAFSTFMRTMAHTALLATPENAMLQVGDLGQAAYNASFTSAIKALPKSLMSMILTDGERVMTRGRLGIGSFENTIRMADLGFSRQHLTEMVNTNHNKWGRFANEVSRIGMTASGVKAMNRLGVETLANAQALEMRKLARISKEKLANSKWAEGLDERGVDRLYRGLRSGTVRDPAVLEAAFFGVGRLHPVSRTAMPTAYLQAKDKRLLWSMRMYMVKMASRFNSDVLEKAAEAERLGINTPKGREMFRDALVNTAKYGTFIVAMNALVDPGRKWFFRGQENENTYGEELVRQSVSFATGGLADTNLIRYNMGPAETLAPPAVHAMLSPIEIVMKALQDPEAFGPEDMRRAGMFVPGVRQILWMHEVAEENPLTN